MQPRPRGAPWQQVGAREDVLDFRLAACALCSSLFTVCPPCDRGQVYCGPLCRRVARGRTNRAARRRHRRSDVGAARARTARTEDGASGGAANRARARRGDDGRGAGEAPCGRGGEATRARDREQRGARSRGGYKPGRFVVACHKRQKKSCACGELYNAPGLRVYAALALDREVRGVPGEHPAFEVHDASKAGRGE